MLKAKLTAEEHAKLDEPLKGLYVDRDGAFVLQVDGMVSQDDYDAIESKLNEFRDNNRKLFNDLKRYEGVDPDEYRTQKQTIEKLQRQGVQKPDDLSALIAQEIAKHTEPLKQQLETERKQREESERKLQEKALEDQLWAAGQAAGISDDMREEYLARAKTLFHFENGRIVARQGDQPVYSRRRGKTTEPLSVEEYVTDPEWLPKEKPKYYKDSTGTGARTQNQGGAGEASRLIANDPSVIGQNLEALAAGKIQVLAGQ